MDTEHEIDGDIKENELSQRNHEKEKHRAGGEGLNMKRQHDDGSSIATSLAEG